MSSETLQGALNVLYKAFFPYENVCIAIGLAEKPHAMKELEELCVNAAKDGVSVVAVEKSSGFVVGAAFNKLQVSLKTMLYCDWLLFKNLNFNQSYLRLIIIAVYA